MCSAQECVADFVRHRENLSNFAGDKKFCLSGLPFLCLDGVCMSPKL